MLEIYEHYISRNIKEHYKRRLVMPILYLLLILLVWNIFSLSEVFFPPQISSDTTLESLAKEKVQYVNTTLHNLQFTGYTRTFWGNTTGYYYYTVANDECFFVLLTPKSCEEGLPSIKELNVSTKLIRGGDTFSLLLNNIAEDLNWTSSGIKSKVSPYHLSESDFNPLGNTLLFYFMAITGLYALFSVICSLVFMKKPILSPACQDLKLFGDPKELLALAEEELATLPQLATEDIFITEHFFIFTSVYGNAIIPIDEILWIYKYSTLNKFLWHHFSISYTLHITANKRLYLQCPKNIKSDIDGIMDYLAEANHNILVGFNEKNRLKVQEIQGVPIDWKKIVQFLKKRI